MKNLYFVFLSSVIACLLCTSTSSDLCTKKYMSKLDVNASPLVVHQSTIFEYFYFTTNMSNSQDSISAILVLTPSSIDQINDEGMANPLILIQQNCYLNLSAEFAYQNIKVDDTELVSYEGWYLSKSYRFINIPMDQIPLSPTYWSLTVQNLPSSSIAATFQYSIQVISNQKCPNQCSGHGQCITSSSENFCSCDESFLGRDCDIEATKITMKKYSPPLELTAKIWKYLYISLDPTPERSTDYVIKISKSSGGKVLIIGKEKGYGQSEIPNIMLYKDYVEKIDDGEQAFHIRIGRHGGIYIFAVYTNDQEPASIQMQILPNNLATFSKLIIVMLVILGFAILLIIGFLLFYCARKRRDDPPEVPPRTSLEGSLRSSVSSTPAMDIDISFPARSYYTIKLFFLVMTKAQSPPPDCRICLDEFKQESQCRIFYCLHVFHSKCIDNWMEQSHDCPLCKRNLNRMAQLKLTDDPQGKKEEKSKNRYEELTNQIRNNFDYTVRSNDFFEKLNKSGSDLISRRISIEQFLKSSLPVEFNFYRDNRRKRIESIEGCVEESMCNNYDKESIIDTTINCTDSNLLASSLMENPQMLEEELPLPLRFLDNNNNNKGKGKRVVGNIQGTRGRYPVLNTTNISHILLNNMEREKRGDTPEGKIEVWESTLYEGESISGIEGHMEGTGSFGVLEELKEELSHPQPTNLLQSECELVENYNPMLGLGLTNLD